jgi:hypothetical protein
VVDDVPAPAPSGDLPSRDELTLAWGDRVLSGLRPKVKMLYAAGRFVDHGGEGAAFALPNKAHAERCEPLRADVEAALSDEFGRSVPLVLVVDGEFDDTPAPAPVAAPAPVDEVADIGPIEELEDAGSAATGLDQVTDIFGKVELLEEEDG